MAIFSNDLTPEEVSSGFALDASDNDTFSLNAMGGDYPEIVPDYDESKFMNIAEPETQPAPAPVIEPIVEVPTAPEPVVEVEQIVEPEPLPQPITSEMTESEMMAADNFEVPDISNMDSGEEVSLDSIFSDAGDDASFLGNIDQIQDIPQPTIKPEEPSDEAVLDLGFDADWLESLKNDIKNAPKIKSVEEPEVAEEVINYGAERPPVLELDSGIEADLMSGTITNLAQDQPEPEVEQIIEPTPEPVPPPPPIANGVEDVKSYSQYSQHIEKEIDKEVVEKKKKKSNTILIVAIIFLAFVLIISGVIGYLYLSNKSNLPTTDVVTDTTKQEQVKHEPVEETETAVDTTQTDSVKVDTVVTPPPEPVVEPTPTPEQKPVEPTPTPKAKDTQKKKSVPAQKKGPSPLDRSAISQRKTPAVKPPAQTGVYTIQIYSSPSLEDAQKRLEYLRSKGLGGVITPQQIRGNTWYRVRFGNYTTYEAAAEAVNKYGFGDAWIEKVK
ncbi:MAG: SPOR domain-containing protein [Ignavibacteria bacterium]|jgi:outer membrane biosynthesis protein TonB|nr:SPOR domain-containing protein [Ignavibacteria bacterium]